MSKRFLYLVALALIPVMPIAATAADLNSEYSEPSPVADAAYDWSGVYVGAQGGVGSPSFPNPFSDKSSWQAGAQAGINYQTGPLVVGAELDGTYSGGTEHRLGGNATLEQTWTGAAKARAGVTFDRTLVYATAGYGLAKLEPKGTVTSGSQWEGGFLYGAGIEHAFSGRISAKAEYNMLKLDDVETRVGGARRTDDLKSQSIKLGLNYRF